jgi:hypothetical protein
MTKWLSCDHKPNTTNVGYMPLYPPKMLTFPDNFPRLGFFTDHFVNSLCLSPLIKSGSLNIAENLPKIDDKY